MQKTKINDEFLRKLKTVVEPAHLLLNEPLSRHTTFKIGGPADFMAQPTSGQEAADILSVAREYNVPVTILGNGSNVLVLDGGIRGLVLKFGENMAYLRHSADKIIAGAGAMLADVSRYAAENALTGLEFAIGIPGSIGGAVFMNAGAYDGEMSNVVSAVSCVTPLGELRHVSHDQVNFGYRHSAFQDNDCAVCEVELNLVKGDVTAIKQKMADYTSRRENKQPLEMPSAGSTFKRPTGYFAGTLIEETGLKGLSVGGAQVSLKHAGFIVNAGGATAQDVLALIKAVQQRVYEHAGVVLQPEVRIIGEE